jgi:hypothetical protein
VLPATQARQEGNLDNMVFSLQARRELFQSLDLIPPEYTEEASFAAVVASGLLDDEPDP